MKQIAKIANALTQFKIVENECITLCLPNTPESFALIYAINKIGAIANIVHPLSTTAEIERALKEIIKDKDDKHLDAVAGKYAVCLHLRHTAVETAHHFHLHGSGVLQLCQHGHLGFIANFF